MEHRDAARRPGRIRRPAFMRAVGATAAAAVLPPWARAARAGKSGPNFVVIMADDLGAKELGCYGRERHRTPHLNAQARTGVRFETCYTAPICHPTIVQNGKHRPTRPDDRFVNKRANFQAHVEYMDKLGGRIVAALGKLELRGSSGGSTTAAPAATAPAAGTSRAGTTRRSPPSARSSRESSRRFPPRSSAPTHRPRNARSRAERNEGRRRPSPRRAERGHRGSRSAALRAANRPPKHRRLPNQNELVHANPDA